MCSWPLQTMEFSSHALLEEAATGVNIACTGMRCCSLKRVLDAAYKLQSVTERSIQFFLGLITLHFCTV